MLDMTMPVLFAILIGLLAVITVGALIAFRLAAERRSHHPQRPQPAATTPPSDPNPR